MKRTTKYLYKCDSCELEKPSHRDRGEIQCLCGGAMEKFEKIEQLTGLRKIKAILEEKRLSHIDEIERINNALNCDHEGAYDSEWEGCCPKCNSRFPLSCLWELRKEKKKNG